MWDGEVGGVGVEGMAGGEADGVGTLVRGEGGLGEEVWGGGLGSCLEGGNDVLEGGNLVRGQSFLFVMVGLDILDRVGSHGNHGRISFVVGLEIIDARLEHVNLLLMLDLAGLELSL